MKKLIRKILIFLRIDITKNLEYDRRTKDIMKKLLRKDSNCLDIGGHKGEIMDDILRFSPNGNHFIFEPIPYLFEGLKKKFTGKCKVMPYALSNNEGKSSFQMVVNHPAYSGIKRRNYDDIPKARIEEIEVNLAKLDNIIPKEMRIDFVKIDVEGGEYDVLLGGLETLKRNKPVIIFECGSGGVDNYGASWRDVYNIITNEIGLKLYTLKAFQNKSNPLKEEEFKAYFQTNQEYYYIAKA